MLNLILIDDEPESLQYISSLVDLYTSDVHIIGQYSDPFIGLEAILKTPPDLLLLDIEMPGLTGLELLKKVAMINFDVIFITAYNQYAIDAFKHHALDYLLKPVDPNDFVKAIQKAKKQLGVKEELEKLKALKSSLFNGVSSLEKQESRIPLATQKSIEFIQLKHIIYIEADKTYSTFHLKNDCQVVVSKNIGTYQDLDEYNIVRCHKSFMVNLHHVARYLHLDGGSLEMNNGKLISVSSKQKEQIMGRLKNL